MKKLVWVACLLVAVFVLPAAAQGIKVGFVNVPTLMEKAPQVAAANKALKKEFSGRDAALATERKAIMRLEKKLQTDGPVMSETKRSDLERKTLKRKREFNRKKDELAEDINLRRSEELNKLQKQIYDVIVSLAKREKYDLIVTQAVVYASPKVDITDKVLSRLKKARR